MLITLGDQRPSYATVNNWIARVNKFSIEDEDRSVRLDSVSTPVNIGAVYDMILSDRRTELKRIAKELIISNKFVHSTFKVDLVWETFLRNEWTGASIAFNLKKSMQAAILQLQLELGYIPSTMKQNSNRWRHSGFRRPNEFRVEEPALKVFIKISQTAK